MGRDFVECDPVLLNRIALAAGSTLERVQLLRLIFDELSRVIRCQSLGFYWRGPSGDFLLAAVGSGGVVSTAERIPTAPDADGPAGSHQPFYSPDNLASTHPVLRFLGGRGLVASICVPVAVAQQLLGWLVASRAKPSSFFHSELRMLAEVASIIAPALNGMQLYERLEAAQRDLASVRDELARSERLVIQGELASGVAHEINNILGLIEARTELLMLQGAGPQVLAAADAIRRAVDDGITVVRRMTQFARKQRSQELVAVEVNRVVEEALEMTRPCWQRPASSPGPDVKVRFEPGQTSAVMGVPAELREVIINLVMNAVDAMPSGGEIEIATLQEGPWVIISVSDTGCGMTEAVRQRIFEPFFTTKGEGGSGLGLWVSNGIVARHGGDIHVQSELGKGTSFRVRLPSAGAIPIRSQAKASAGGRSILVVDDEAGLGETLKLALQMEGYRVEFFADPQRALAAFKESPFDLVITDLRMPGMTGWELAGEIKRVSPHTPIIAMTGWPVDLMREGNGGSSVEAIIQKPYRVNDLRAKVASLLPRRSDSTAANPA